MASYTMKDIDGKFWRELKAECAYGDIRLKGLILDLLKSWLKVQKIKRRLK